MLDVLIRNGRVVDGAGNPWFPADVGIQDGKITMLGAIADDVGAATVLDAAGSMVAPGFIDIHSHSDFVVADPAHGEILAPFAAQGITTLVTGNCGYSPAPVNPLTRPALQSYTAFLRSADLPDAWSTFADYLAFLDTGGADVQRRPDGRAWCAADPRGRVRGARAAGRRASPNS